MRDYRDWMEDVRAETEGDAATLDRVSARLARGRRRPPLALLAVPVAAAAAAAMLMFTPPPSVDRRLDDAGKTALGDMVRVDAQGVGGVEGTARRMRIDWSSGALDVAVAPKQGVALEVVTEEGTARVVGTAFTVDRGPLGTEVRVREGAVAVVCTRGGAHDLRPGESRVCPPVRGATALRRALALRASLAPPALLEEVDVALTLPGANGAVAAELLALRADTLVGAGRFSEALDATEVALASPDVTRPTELHRTAARLAGRLGDCARAVPHLRALASADALGDDAPALAACGG